jgi:hypothetical protein
MLDSVRSEQWRCGTPIQGFCSGWLFPMACPHCGEHLLHQRDGLLRCCRCNRIRQDLASGLRLGNMLRHLPILLIGALLLPIALGMGSIDAGRSAAEGGATGVEQAED